MPRNWLGSATIEMIISLGFNDVAQMATGTYLVLAWYAREEGGQKFAPAKYDGVLKDKLKITVKPHGGGCKQLKLSDYKDTHFADGRRQEYKLKIPTAKELIYCKNTFGDDTVDQEELFVAPSLSAKEIAIALMTVMTEKPTGAKKLCKAAKIQYVDMVPLVLKKLVSLGKLSSIRVQNAKGVLVRRYSRPGPS